MRWLASIWATWCSLSARVVIAGPVRLLEAAEQGAIIGPRELLSHHFQHLVLRPFTAFDLGEDGRSDENLAARVVSAFLFGFGGLYPCLCLLLQCLGLFELVLQILDSLLCFLDVGCHDYPLRFYPGILYR